VLVRPPNHAAESSTAKVREFRYAAREAEEEASTPELERVDVSGESQRYQFVVGTCQ
jgi:hypothetical protein